MARSTFRVLFYANGSKEKNGTVPIMGRVTINGTVAQFSCKRSISKELWDAKGNRAKGKSLEARETNLALDNIKADGAAAGGTQPPIGGTASQVPQGNGEQGSGTPRGSVIPKIHYPKSQEMVSAVSRAGVYGEVLP